MRERVIALPEIILLAATRGMIGFGAGLLLAPRIHRDRRRILGWVLFSIGAVSTIPLAIRVFRRGTNHHQRDMRGAAAAAMSD